MTYLRLIAAVALALVAALPARAFETRATAAWVYDMTNSAVLLAKNSDQPLPPASMSKLMTLNMLFEALKDGRVTMETTFAVSDRAVQMTRDGGSTMMLQHEDRPTVDELIHGMIVNSGNDACVVVAEGLAGTEEAFAQQMTLRGPAIGLFGPLCRPSHRGGTSMVTATTISSSGSQRLPMARVRRAP